MPTSQAPPTNPMQHNQFYTHYGFILEYSSCSTHVSCLAIVSVAMSANDVGTFDTILGI
jgi:hypothetical protein